MTAGLAPQWIAVPVEQRRVRPTQVDEVAAPPSQTRQLAIRVSDVGGSGTLTAAENDAVVDFVDPSMFESLPVIHRPHILGVPRRQR